jgi:succinoglycan biosynthesis protein ExoM
MLVSICIITYQRPEGIERLIDRIGRLEFKYIEPPNLEIIVVDNDLAGLACKFCEQIKLELKWPITFGIESERGISYARNHAIDLASKASKFIVTIDDDEVPESQWLEELLLVQQKYDADVVAGPVLPFFSDKNVPNWVKKGKFFDLPRYPTGYPIQVAFAGNVLVRSEILRKLDKPFDERFSLTGGEDSDLFMRLFQAGYKMVWANDAIAHESIPQTRTTIGYILRRAYRSWSTHSLLERELYPSFQVQSIRTFKGIGLIVIGILLIIPSLFQGKYAVVKALRFICRGCGTISGLLGINYEEYR